MKNMKNKKTQWHVAILVLLLPLGAKAQFFSSVAFSAVNKVTVAAPVTVVEQTSTSFATTNTELIQKNEPDASMQSTTNVSGIDNSDFILKKTDTDMESKNASGINSDVYSMYTTKLCLTYAVPAYVYYDWKHVHDRCNYLVANGYQYMDPALNSRLFNLAYNDFTCYSNYSGFQQKLEFRAGTGVIYQYSGAYPPVMPNYNPVLSTKTFAAP